MSRALLAASTCWPVGMKLQALAPSCTAAAYASWHSVDGVSGGRRRVSSTEEPSTKRERALDGFTDRLPDRLHPDDLHFLLKFLEGVPLPQRAEPTVCRGAPELRFGDGAGDGPSGAACCSGGAGTVDAQPGSSSSDGKPRPVCDLGRAHHGGKTTACTTTSINTSTSTAGSLNGSAGIGGGTSQAGRCHSTAAGRGGGGSGSSSSSGSDGNTSAHRRGKQHAQQQQHEYDDQYDHLHNVIFERLRQPSHGHSHSHAYVHVELHGFEDSGAGGYRSYGRSDRGGNSSCSTLRARSWRHPGPQHHHQISGPGPEVGGGGDHRRTRRWECGGVSYSFCDDADEVGDGDGEWGNGSRRRGLRRGGGGWKTGTQDYDEVDEWGELGGGASPNPGRTQDPRQRRSANGQQESQTNSNRLNHQQQKQGQQHPGTQRGDATLRSRDGATDSQQDQKQQQQRTAQQQRRAEAGAGTGPASRVQGRRKPRDRRQGVRGVAWFTRRWPWQYVSHEEYVDFMSAERGKEGAEGGSSRCGGSSGKYYRSAFEGDRDWFSQFWSNDAAGSGSIGSTSSSSSHFQHQSYSNPYTHSSHSSSHSSSRHTAEQFTASWWQRFQATSSAGAGGARSSSSSRTHSQSGSSQYDSQYGSSQHQHPPELRAHMRMLGLELHVGTLDAAAVKAAFRTRAKETHPDLQHGANAAARAAAEERFKAVQQAYQALSRAVGLAVG